MQKKANIRHELAARLQNLPAEQIKVAVLKLLGQAEAGLEDLSLELEQKPEKHPLELSPAEKAKAFRKWAESHRHGLPLLNDEAISRESIYSDEQL